MIDSRIQPAQWYLYVLRTNCGSLYTGITKDVPRRLQEHSFGNKGAKSLRGKGPLTLVYQSEGMSHSDALKLEISLKKKSKSHKEQFIKEACL